jgi:hypothetical protein
MYITRTAGAQLLFDSRFAGETDDGSVPASGAGALGDAESAQQHAQQLRMNRERRSSGEGGAICPALLLYVQYWRMSTPAGYRCSPMHRTAHIAAVSALAPGRSLT